jgi:hypothetical protein
MKDDHKKTFFILDLDRTLIKTDEMFLLLRRAVAENGSIDVEMFERGKQQHTFDAIAYLRELLVKSLGADEAEVQLAAIHLLFRRDAKYADLREPYATELVHELEEKGKTFCIMTKGGQEWQQYKLEAAGFKDVPQGDDGYFAIPRELSPPLGATYGEVVMLDDKSVSFAHSPKGLKGIWVHPLGVRSQEASHLMDLPRDLVEVHGLKEAREILKQYELL